MHATTLAVDPTHPSSYSLWQMERLCIVETQHLKRLHFERWWANQSLDLFNMEACGSIHYWTRWLEALVIEGRLSPHTWKRPDSIATHRHPMGATLFLCQRGLGIERLRMSKIARALSKSRTADGLTCDEALRVLASRAHEQH